MQTTTSFDNNPPVAHNKYDESIRQFCAGYETIFITAYSYLSSLIKEDARLLVVGAGTGTEICEFGKRNSKWKMTGVDPSGEMLSIAQQKIVAHKLNNPINLFQGYTSDLKTEDLYDGATCILVMHFVNDDGSKLELLKSISDRLKSGAPLILVDGFGVEDNVEFRQAVSAWKRFVMTTGVDYQTVEDGFNNQILKRIKFVSEERIKTLLNEAGFENSYRFFTSFLYGGWVTVKR